MTLWLVGWVVIDGEAGGFAGWPELFVTEPAHPATLSNTNNKHTAEGALRRDAGAGTATALYGHTSNISRKTPDPPEEQAIRTLQVG